MKKLLSVIRPLALISIMLFIVLIIIKPEVCTYGAKRGIMLCGKVIIPSLFPFTVCVLYIVKSGMLSKLKFLYPISAKIFHLTPEQFSIMLLSCIGGYPIGAKLINELYSQNKISKKNAKLMINFCVNAGPAFIVIAVGSTLYSSKTIGYILLISHLFSSLIIALIFSNFIKCDNLSVTNNQEHISLTDNFVASTSDAASAVLGICGYVILFSTISSYLECFSEKFFVLKYISYFLEVTVGISSVHNLLFASFLLGFSGICIWCQVLSVTKKFRFNLFLFSVVRIFHGLISVILTAIILKIFNIDVAVYNNGASYSANYVYTTVGLSISMLCMAILFLLSLTSKKNSRNIIKNLV